MVSRVLYYVNSFVFANEKTLIFNFNALRNIDSAQERIFFHTALEQNRMFLFYFVYLHN